MPFKLSELLNPAPSSTSSPTRPSDDTHAPTTATASEAGSALNAPKPGTQDSFPSQNPYSEVRPQSSYGPLATPVEPAPPVESSQPFSPTLEQYHHGSKSPEERRRQSQVDPVSSATKLAPIQNFSSSSNAQMADQSQADEKPYGHDASHIVSHSHSLQDDASGQSEDAQAAVQQREPGYVRDEPTTSQIRQPSPSAVSAIQLAAAAPLSLQYESQPSPLPNIKSEPTETPREGTPSSAAMRTDQLKDTIPGADQETLKTVAELQNEHGLRGANRDASSSTTEAPKPAAPPKKRSAPKSTAAANKKGIAKKPSAKKRKVEVDDVNGAAGSRRNSNTPLKGGATKKSHSGTPHGSSPPAHTASSPAAESGDEDSDSDGGVFCICRGPDDHTWMIGCDGGCDDWFHGHCVNLRREEHEKLIDRYICPNCERDGRGHTAWKPMCRREGCNMPARLTKNAYSKYCSDECGTQFFQNILAHVEGGKGNERTAKKRTAARKKANQPDHAPAERDDDMDADDDGTPSRGGVIRPSEVKALAFAVPEEAIADFRRLGSGVLSPPTTASPTKPAFANGAADTAKPDAYTLNTSESARVTDIAAEKRALRQRLALLKDREQFVNLVRQNVAIFAEREGLKPKEVCGFDPRLAWSDGEFQAWRVSKFGKAALKHGTLEPTEAQIDAEVEGDAEPKAETKADTDPKPEVEAKMPDGDAMDVDGEDKKDAPAPIICPRKRCQRHPGWQRLQFQDAKFEQVQVLEALKRLDSEEREVRERAMVRWRREVVARDLDGLSGVKEGAGGVKRDREGWAEVVGV